MILSPEQERDLAKILTNGNAMANGIFAALGVDDLPSLDELDKIDEAYERMEEGS